MSKEDFIKFYFDKKDELGIVKLKTVSKKFGFKDTINNGYLTTNNFVDATGKKFIKPVFSKEQLDAEILLPKIYEKLGLTSCKNFPIKNRKGNMFVVSTNVLTDNTLVSGDYRLNIFANGWRTFSKQDKLSDGTDKLTGKYSENAIKDLLKLRLLDTATFNTDRHQHNFFYTIETKEDGAKVATSIKAIDYEDSGGHLTRSLGKEFFFNNFVEGGDDWGFQLSREQMIDEFKNNETSNIFLPKQECAEILGSVNFQKEAKTLAEETGYFCNQNLVDAWDKSFCDMAGQLIR